MHTPSGKEITATRIRQQIEEELCRRHPEYKATIEQRRAFVAFLLSHPDSKKLNSKLRVVKQTYHERQK